jgi:predicted RNase H-like HicB family nuclease
MEIRGVKNYTVVLTPDPDGIAINVRVPAMPGIFTWGVTRGAALAAAREAIELYLGQYVERGEPFPGDRQGHGDAVAIPVLLPQVPPEAEASSRVAS